MMVYKSCAVAQSFIDGFVEPFIFNLILQEVSRLFRR